MPTSFPTPTLAQSLPGLNQPNIPELPDPPPFDRYVLENPWPLAIALVLLGLFAGVILLQRGKAKVALPAILGGVALAGLAALVGSLVTTPREAVAARTRELVEAVSRRDIPAVEQILDPDVNLYYFRFAGPANLDHVRQQLRTDFGASVDVPSVHVTGLQATVDNPGVARTQVGVNANSNAGAEYGFGSSDLRSWWRLYWRQDANGDWRAEELELLWIDLPGVNNPSGR